MCLSPEMEVSAVNGSMATSSECRTSGCVSKPWRILHTESSMGLGGQEYRVLNEARGMEQRGHRAILAIPRNSQITFLAEQKGLSYEATPSGTLAWSYLIFTYLRIIHRHRIQIVNTHGSLDSWAASLAGRLSPLKPIIIRTRHKSTPISQTWRHQWLYKHLPHGVMTTSERIRKDMVMSQALDPAQVRSVPTGVDLEVYSATNIRGNLREEFGLAHDAIVLGTVAFLRDYKGIHLCLDAINLLRHSVPNVRFLVVGEGPEGLRLREKAEALGLQQHVHFAGFRSDVHQVLAALDVFVLSSTAGEGVPQAVTQAMAMGVPVVAAAIGGIPEVVIHEKTGMLVPENNINALTHCIQVILNDVALREKVIREAKALVAQSYSLDRMLDSVEQFYGEMLQATSVSVVGSEG